MSEASSHTELPKQYDHAAAQARWYKFWEDNGYFHSEPDPDRKPYTIVIPPPNVTGALHLGHALNNSLQDILIRKKRMEGFATLWMPGTDHAGIATQAVVERRLLEEEKITRHDIGREGLVERIWEWKEEYEARILGQLKEMGCSCDWQRTRFTLDPMCARAVRQTFFRLFQDSLIYRGKKLVNWDTTLKTAVSDDELDHKKIDGSFWHFKYPVIDPLPGEPEYVTIATTRPETMLGDTAVAVHPEPASALNKVEAELEKRLAAAPEKEKAAIQTQIDSVREQRETMLDALVVLRDMALGGRKVMLPLMDREIPLVADMWAKPEKGTGCVKITPAHDPNDYTVGLRQNLPMINILRPDGTLNDETKQYEGQTIKQARKNVVADLEKLGLMVKVEDHEFELAHSDRSKTPIEPYLSDQWFLKMDDLAQTAMDAVTDSRVRIIPERYKKSYLDWLGEKRDWCIGRQLWWGHRIPVWRRTLQVADDLQAKSQEFQDGLKKLKTTGAPKEEIDQLGTQYDDFLTSNCQAVDAIRAKYGDRVAMQVRPETESGGVTVFLCVPPDDEATEKQLETEDGFAQDEDVLDTWFSSALWPHSTLGWPEQTEELKFYYKTSVLITSRDIITLWVARMVLTGLYNVGDIPFDDVYIHPKILDGYGEGMSKSKGNGVDPIDVMNKFGADSMRFGLAYLTTETQDFRMPVDFECPHCGELTEQTRKNRQEPRLKCKSCKKDFATQWARTDEDLALPKAPVVSDRFELARNFCNKLWNASRFTLMNLEGYTPAPVADEELRVEDRWLLSRLSTVTRQVSELLDNYKYSDAARTLYDFAWDEFCSFYVEMTKSRFQDDATRASAQRLLAHTLDTLLRLLHPMIPFVTEEVWQLLAKFAPERGLESPQPAAESIMIAPWPEADAEHEDPTIEARFARFQEVLRGIRDVRARQNVPPKQEIEFSIRCDDDTAELLRPMEPYFTSMAGALPTDIGPYVESPELSAGATLAGIEIFVDLADLIDVDAEIARKEQELQKLEGFMTGKRKKLENANFVDRAPAEVVQRERDGLAELEEQHATIEAAIERMKKLQKKQ